MLSAAKTMDANVDAIENLRVGRMVSFTQYWRMESKDKKIEAECVKSSVTQYGVASSRLGSNSN